MFWRQVIPQRMRTTAFALDTCIAGVLGFASTPLVGVLAQRAGYRQEFNTKLSPAAAAAESVRNARALENSLLLLVLVTSAAKFLVRGLPRTTVTSGLKGEVSKSAGTIAT